MNQPAQQTPAMTLGDINQRLSKHNLPAIVQNQIEAVLQIASREDIINAVLDLDYTPEAKVYLEKCFKQAGIFQPRTTYRGNAGHPQGGNPPQGDRAGVHTMPQGTGGPRMPGQAPQARAPQTAPAQSRPQTSGQGQAHSRPPAASQANGPTQNGGGTNRSDGAGSNSVPIEERMSTHVYARNKAALCFEADVTQNGFKTVALDGAKAMGQNFDWGNKTRIQLTKGEMPAVLAVLAGYSQFCEFKNHGPANNKGFSMERQGEKVYVKVFEKSKPMIGVPIHPQDLFYVYSLVMKRVLDENPWLDAMAVLQMVRATQPNKAAPASENPPHRKVGGYTG